MDSQGWEAFPNYLGNYWGFGTNQTMHKTDMWSHMVESILLNEGLPCSSSKQVTLSVISIAHPYTQVLSSTVADALTFEDCDETVETRQYIRLLDMFFDCLNVQNPTEGKLRRKGFREPYTSPHDEQFNVCNFCPSILQPMQITYNFTSRWLRSTFDVLGWMEEGDWCSPWSWNQTEVQSAA